MSDTTEKTQATQNNLRRLVIHVLNCISEDVCFGSSWVEDLWERHGKEAERLFSELETMHIGVEIKCHAEDAAGRASPEPFAVARHEFRCLPAEDPHEYRVVQRGPGRPRLGPELAARGWELFVRGNPQVWRRLRKHKESPDA